MLLLPGAASAQAQKPRAERLAYQLGDKWMLNDGAYELVRIDKAESTRELAFPGFQVVTVEGTAATPLQVELCEPRERQTPKNELALRVPVTLDAGRKVGRP